MAEHDSKTEDDGTAAGESLNDALNDLEHIIDGDDRDPPGAEKHGAAPAPDDAGQYSIPLLDDVVLPGPNPAAVSDPLPGKVRHGPAYIEHDRQCQDVIKRLANEIEVIVHAGVEEALKKAHREITVRIKRHLEITLPEILDEIADIKSRKGF